MKVAYVGGFWATNIGNAFYNLGAIHLLEYVFGSNNVFFVPDPPQWYWRTNNDYPLLENLDIDLCVISGPCLIMNGRMTIKSVYKSIFDKFKAKGIKLALLSVGSQNNCHKEASAVADFLNHYNISFMSTRDRNTYNLYKNLVSFPIFDGICTSMFLNDTVKIVPLSGDSYTVFNFAKKYEPIICIKKGVVEIKKRRYLSFQSEFDGNKIVRTNNEPFSKYSVFKFDRKNTYYSDLPYGYLSILKHAKNVFSDRVHSCAATLIMGGTAMYIKGSNRSKDTRNLLLQRIGVGDDIEIRPCKLDMDFILKEKSLLTDFLMSQKTRLYS
jgi:hypothetical protein